MPFFPHLLGYERFQLEDFGQLSNHLGADSILFVLDLTNVVHGRMMQQYLAFLDVPYDKVYHSSDSGESIFTQFRQVM